MITRLPAGNLTPVPAGRTSSPCPGAHAVSHGVCPIWARPESRERGLAEAGPPLAARVGGIGRRYRGGRDEEEDGVMHLDAVRVELARDDERVLGHVGVDQRAVVVVGGPGRRVGRVGLGLHGDGGDWRRRGTGAGAHHPHGHGGGGQDSHQGQADPSRRHGAILAVPGRRRRRGQGQWPRDGHPGAATPGVSRPPGAGTPRRAARSPVCRPGPPATVVPARWPGPRPSAWGWPV